MDTENEIPRIFEAKRVEAGSVSKTGALAALELVANGERLWLTVPVGCLQQLSQLCLELDALAIDAKNGVASHWHILTEKAPPEDGRSRGLANAGEWGVSVSGAVMSETASFSAAIE
jgi:hypothetical protein